MITDRQSPNFSARPPGFDIDLLILHYTGMDSAAAACVDVLHAGSRVCTCARRVYG